VRAGDVCLPLARKDFEPFRPRVVHRRSLKFRTQAQTVFRSIWRRGSRNFTRDWLRKLAITLVMQESIPGICAAEVEALRAEEIDGQRGRGAVSVLRLPRNTGQR